MTGQSYDTLSVRVVDPRSIAMTTKKGGKIVAEQTRTVSDDGNTMTIKVTSHPKDSDQPVNTEVTFTRLGKALLERMGLPARGESTRFSNLPMPSQPLTRPMATS